MTTKITIDPAFHGERVQECVEAFNSGSHREALTLSMEAGIDAGVLGLAEHECPFKDTRMIDHAIQWAWGRGQAMEATKHAEQGTLL